MFILEDDELIFYGFHLFNPVPITTPLELVINNPPNVPQEVPQLYLLEVPYSPIYNPNPLSGIL